jgi:ADP-heptose:LPS heptosyltransferase
LSPPTKSWGGEFEKTFPQNILICRTDAIGDALLTLPVAAALKQAWPRAQVVFLASAYAADILEGQPGLDEVWAYAPGSRAGLKKLIVRLRQSRFDAALLVFPDRWVSWAVWRSGIPVRVGTARRWWSWLYSQKVAVSRAQGNRHEAEYNLDLVRALGVEAKLKPPRLRLFSEAKRWAQAYLKAQGIKSGHNLIVVHPGGRGSAANWPPEKYRELVQRLARWPKTRVLLTGSAAEQNLLAEVARGCSPAPDILRDSISLKQLAALLAQARVMISGNTGPMHIAAGLNVPTVSFFPPAGVTGPGRWRPLGNRQEVLTPAAQDQADMETISVERAERAVRRLAGRHGK